MSECRKLISLIGRNTKCYFKDIFTFFMSLLTPIILFILFVTFLRTVYIDNFERIFSEYGISIEPRILNGVAGAWLMSSILSVSAVTVAFCSNTVMIADKINSSVNDFRVSPVKGTTISLAYFVSNFFVTFIVLITVMLIGHIYLAAIGWYIPVGDVFLILYFSALCLRESWVVSFPPTAELRRFQLWFRQCTVLFAALICPFQLFLMGYKTCFLFCPARIARE